MRSKLLAGAAAFAVTAAAILATAGPASAQRWHRALGWGVAGAAAGVVGGVAAAATAPWWAPGYYGGYSGYAYAPGYAYDDTYAYAPVMSMELDRAIPMRPATPTEAVTTPTVLSGIVRTIRRAEPIWALTAFAIPAHDQQHDPAPGERARGHSFVMPSIR